MPSSTYIPLANVTLGSSATTVTFSGIPTTPYRDLILVFSGTLSANTGIGLELNLDTSSNYLRMLMIGTGSGTVTASQVSNQFGEGSTSATNNIFEIMDYAATNKQKTVLARVASTGSMVAANHGIFQNTAAITSIRLRPAGGNSFGASSTFCLYGIE